MAQTKKKRRRKHRGTQGGSIDTSRRQSRPRTKEEARARAKSRQSGAVRVDAVPTWRSATIRGLVAAAIFTVFLILVLGRDVGPALLLGLFMLAFYIPAGKFVDTMMWRRRERARMRAETGSR